MSSKRGGGKKGKTKNQVAVGDTFNETEDDKTQSVVEVHPERDPPVALCRSIKRENESTETEQEYALEYVENCVKSRREFDKMGFNQSDVYDIYQMSKTKLKTASETEHSRSKDPSKVGWWCREVVGGSVSGKMKFFFEG